MAQLTAKKTAITQLELSTIGFVGCALAMYMMWWDKPFDVEHRVPIVCPPARRDSVTARLRAMFEERYSSKFLAPTWEDFVRERRIRNWAYMDDLGIGTYHRMRSRHKWGDPSY